MADTFWLGQAVAIKDKWTITVANTWATNDTGTVTINGKNLVVTIGSVTTTAGVATSIKEAWESATFTDTTASCSPSGGGTTIPEMSELTATVSGSTVILTADTAGVPHTITVSESTVGTGTLSIAHTTTATGPNYWDNTGNWSGGAVPSTENVYIDRPVSILYGLNQSAVTVPVLHVSARFSSSAYIGLPARNTTGTGYDEYRDTYLKISATAFTTYSGSGRIKINFGTNQNTSHIFSTGTTTETGRAALQLLGTHASNAINVYGGDVGIAANTGEVSTYATVKQTGGTLELGPGCTLTNVTNTGGTISVASSTTTLLHEDGTLIVNGGTATALTAINGSVTITGTTTVTTLRVGSATVDAGINTTFTTIDSAAGTLTLQSGCTTLTNDSGTVTVTAGSITTANINGGTFNYRGAGTITTLNIRPQGLSGDETILVDFTGTTAGCTVTTVNVTARPVKFEDPSSRVTWTNGLPVGGSITFE